jgi:hypothetical protein
MMAFSGREQRVQKRKAVDPSDTGTFLQFAVDGKKYRFTLIDKSANGMGMLVPNEEGEVLRHLEPGNKLKFQFQTPKTKIVLNSEIRHVTALRRGIYKGDHKVGIYHQQR